MSVEITQVVTRATKQYPWTHRVRWRDLPVASVLEIQCWTENDGIPGQWVSGSVCTLSACSAFYTTEEVATYIALKWS